MLPQSNIKKNRLPVAVIILSCLALLLLLEAVGIFQGLNTYLYDLAFRYRGACQPDERIQIITVDEKALQRFGSWPLPRERYAQLLDMLQDARAVGLDLILAEPSPDDLELGAAIRRHGRVALATYVDSRLNLVRPVEALAGAQLGHIHLEQGVDGVVREMYHRIAVGDQSIESLAAAMYALDTSRRVFPVPHHTASGQDLIVQTDTMVINYSGGGGSFPYLSLADVLDGQYSRPFFKDKYVLVGVTAAGIDEGVLTPYGAERKRLPSVEAHAHILGNLLQDNAIRLLPRWAGGLATTLIFLGGFALFVAYGGYLTPVFFTAGLGLITTAAYLLFSQRQLWVAPAPLYAALATSFILAYIIKLERMRRRLRQARDDWEESFNTLDDAIVIQNAQGRIVRANQAAQAAFGPSGFKLLRQRYQELMNDNRFAVERVNAAPPTAADLAVEKIDDDANVIYEIKSLPRYGAAGQLKGMVQVARDVTAHKQSEKEYRRLQAQLIRAQKLEAIGTLAGGIAHDFNNLLMVLIGNTELLMAELPPDAPPLTRLRRVLQAAQRARALVEQILTFSRQQSGESPKQPVQLQLIVKEDLKLLRSTLPSTIRLEHAVHSEQLVMADPSQLHQVVMNLCTNAYHAMGQEGGTLKVYLIDAKVGQDHKPHTSELTPGDYVLLSISDTGHGIAPDILHRIFEPYFTTKEKGVGTGLGLSTVHGIVKGCGGAVALQSKVGQGTTFHCYFPVVENQSLTEGGPASIPPSSGKGRVLFVDDERELVALGQEMLEHYGYTVTPVADSRRALELFQNDPQAFDLVITDLIMPELTGEKLAQAMMQIRPGIPVILCTGFSEHCSKEEAAQIGIKAFVFKPIVLRQLIETVHSVLGEAKASQR